ncbi:MAG: steroid delta-isomerase [Mongoliibacter sp.]|nr:MAG: steroid delta-isomerase [Mongoliibacter sp.]
MFICGFSQAQDGIEEIAEKLAQEQLDAYNNRDIDAFLAPYAENVKIFNFPNDLQYEGKDNMRERYKNMFANSPDLHCKLVNRMVMGNTVIDQEEVVRRKGDSKIHAIAIYKIKNDKIAEVYFISK